MKQINMLANFLVLIIFMLLSKEIHGNVEKMARLKRATAPQNDTYNILIEVIQASHLPNGDLFSSDPYAELSVGGKYIGETSTEFETNNPDWNTVFEIRGVKPNTNATVVFIDRDAIDPTGDDKLGEATFTIGGDMFQKPNDTIVMLISRGNDTHNLTDSWVNPPSTRITIWAHLSTDDADAQLQVPMATGPVKYTKFISQLGGAIADTEVWTAYEVQLHGIDQIMSKKFPYNKDYPSIQRFFKPNSLSAQAVHLEHQALYRHAPDTVYDVMSNSTDFFKAINNGRREEKLVMFTYIINDKVWRFSETGAGVVDFMSKHIMHSDVAKEVVYAGEFHVRGDDNDTLTLVIDNNSGSYAPSKDALPELKALLEMNFPGMRVDAVDREESTSAAERKTIMAGWSSGTTKSGLSFSLLTPSAIVFILSYWLSITRWYL